MIASLMMYARPELAEAHHRLWQLIRQQLQQVGIESPALLSQDAEEFSVWNDPGLVLSQTCGMPYRLMLHNNVQLVGTPNYAIEGCKPGYYRSALVVRKNDERERIEHFENATFAYNQTHSQSGYAAPYFHIQAHKFWFQKRLQTHQHRESAKAVAKGLADIAALDAMSWRLMCRYDDFATQLRVLEWTEPTPGLPLITAQSIDSDAVFTAVTHAIERLDTKDRSLLNIEGLVKIDKQAYLSIPSPPQ